MQFAQNGDECVGACVIGLGKLEVVIVRRTDLWGIGYSRDGMGEWVGWGMGVDNFTFCVSDSFDKKRQMRLRFGFYDIVRVSNKFGEG